VRGGAGVGRLLKRGVPAVDNALEKKRVAVGVGRLKGRGGRGDCVQATRYRVRGSIACVYSGLVEKWGRDLLVVCFFFFLERDFVLHSRVKVLGTVFVGCR